uniref:Uncharacterized protein n=1 Tax=Anopheles merus TaxID=30066 RepID=A0A182UR34_ANOME
MTKPELTPVIKDRSFHRGGGGGRHRALPVLLAACHLARLGLGPWHRGRTLQVLQTGVLLAGGLRSGRQYVRAGTGCLDSEHQHPVEQAFAHVRRQIVGGTERSGGGRTGRIERRLVVLAVAAHEATVERVGLGTVSSYAATPYACTRCGWAVEWVLVAGRIVRSRTWIGEGQWWSGDLLLRVAAAEVWATESVRCRRGPGEVGIVRKGSIVAAVAAAAATETVARRLLSELLLLMAQDEHLQDALKVPRGQWTLRRDVIVDRGRFVPWWLWSDRLLHVHALGGEPVGAGLTRLQHALDVGGTLPGRQHGGWDARRRMGGVEGLCAAGEDAAEFAVGRRLAVDDLLRLRLVLLAGLAHGRGQLAAQEVTADGLFGGRGVRVLSRLEPLGPGKLFGRLGRLGRGVGRIMSSVPGLVCTVEECVEAAVGSPNAAARWPPVSVAADVTVLSVVVVVVVVGVVVGELPPFIAIVLLLEPLDAGVVGVVVE